MGSAAPKTVSCHFSWKITMKLSRRRRLFLFTPNKLVKCAMLSIIAQWYSMISPIDFHSDIPSYHHECTIFIIFLLVTCAFFLVNSGGFTVAMFGKRLRSPRIEVEQIAFRRLDFQGPRVSVTRAGCTKFNDCYRVCYTHQKFKTPM